MLAPITSEALGLETSPEDSFGDLPGEQRVEEEVSGANVEANLGGGEVEAEERVRVPDPQLPHPDVVAEHNLDHTPYRSWCRWCVEGRGVGEQHRPKSGEHDVPVIGMDCFCLTGKGFSVQKGWVSRAGVRGLKHWKLSLGKELLPNA